MFCIQSLHEHQELDHLFGITPEESKHEDAATKARHERMALAKRMQSRTIPCIEDQGMSLISQSLNLLNLYIILNYHEITIYAAVSELPEQSLVCLEVYPWKSNCDLHALWRKIVTNVCDHITGLKWGQSYVVEPVAFGINKLVMTCVIDDDFVLLADITDPIEQKLKRVVQSVQMVTMNKIPGIRDETRQHVKEHSQINILNKTNEVL